MGTGTHAQPASRLVLASTSPRRRALLARAGIAFDVIDPGVDDGQLHPGGVSPREWVGALAYLKARAGAERLVKQGSGGPHVWILGADTLVAHRGTVLGKPRDAHDARAMLERLMNDAHEVFTGVALVPATAEALPQGIAAPCVRSLVDRAVSHLGPLTAEQLSTYIASGQWSGKAGAYNLEERKAAGWPIRADGDETCVVGLPMRAVEPWLAEFRSGTAARGAGVAA